MSNKPICYQAQIRDVRFGKNIKVVEPVNLYECVIGDDCFIGPFVEIQKGVVLGDRTKIQSHAFICELVRIGSDCFISHGAKFVNDLFATGGPAGGDQTLWKETRLGHHVSVGTNATVLPVFVCNHVVIGAGTVVTKDIKEPGIYVGNPARKIRDLEPMHD